jgi:hypothetical protein
MNECVCGGEGVQRGRGLLCIKAGGWAFGDVGR